jgi:hypothetical protein
VFSSINFIFSSYSYIYFHLKFSTRIFSLFYLFCSTFYFFDLTILHVLYFQMNPIQLFILSLNAKKCKEVNTFLNEISSHFKVDERDIKKS